MDLMGIFGLINFFFAIVIGLYFLTCLNSSRGPSQLLTGVEKGAGKTAQIKGHLPD